MSPQRWLAAPVVIRAAAVGGVGFALALFIAEIAFEGAAAALRLAA